MWLLIVLAAILALILLIGYFPIRFAGSYDENGGAFWIALGPYKIPLFPNEKRKKADRNRKETDKGSSAGSFGKFFNDLMDILALLEKLRAKLRITLLEGKLILAGEDPYDLAMYYGSAWAAVGAINPLLDSILEIKKKDIAVACDFASDATRYYIRVRGYIRLFDAAKILLGHFKNKLNTSNNKKAVLKYE